MFSAERNWLIDLNTRVLVNKLNLLWLLNLKHINDWSFADNKELIKF